MLPSKGLVRLQLTILCWKKKLLFEDCASAIWCQSKLMPSMCRHECKWSQNILCFFLKIHLWCQNKISILANQMPEKGKLN